MKLQIRLSWLFALVLISALVMGVLIQFGIQTSEIEIIANELRPNVDGTVSGELTWCFTEETEPGELPPFVICLFQHIDRSELVKLTRGDRFTIRFRAHNFGPMNGEDPYKVFLNGVLEIDSAQIKDAEVKGELALILIEK